MIEAIIKLIEKLLPVLTGWFIAKQSNDISNLKEEKERKDEYDKIDDDNISANDAYLGMLTKK